MKLNTGFDISSSALTASRLRMDVISSNIANAETTRYKVENGEYVPYKRKLVVLDGNQKSFSNLLSSSMSSSEKTNQLKGVRVSQIIEDTTPTKLVYNPSHPDANSEGYVEMPNVDTAVEMVDMIAAYRAYESNVTALNASKSMFQKSLTIGKG